MTESEKNQQAVEKTESKIKLLLLFIILYSLPRRKYLLELMLIVNSLDSILSKNLVGREKILEDVVKSTEQAIDKIIKPIEKDIKRKHLEDIFDPKFEVKGTPYISYYDRVIKKALEGLDKWKLVTSEVGKRPITLWQKIELDTRHQAQMKMVDEAKKSGQDLWWLSAHIDSSERCEKWQGKLVSLTMKPKAPYKFFTGKTLDGEKIYSFEAIESVVDKYGYTNNIINGFNCRHRLISRAEQSEPPRTWKKENVENENKKNNYLRYLERKIRKLKQRMKLEEYVDKKSYIRHKNQVAHLTNYYKQFCIKNGFAMELWRLSV